QPRLLVEALDHHQLDVQQLIEVFPDLIGEVRDDRRQLLQHPRIDGLAYLLGQLRPQPRMLPSHDAVDGRAHIVARDLDDLVGHLLGLELIPEFRWGPELCDADVHGQAAHLGRARGHDPLPPDPSHHQSRDLADASREHAHDMTQRGNPQALEVDGVEQHQHPGPVRQIADRAREERNGDQRDESVAAHSTSNGTVARLMPFVAVITGASSGIGEATARRFAREPDAALVLVARRRDRLDALAAELGGATVVAVDLTYAEAPRIVREAVEREHGRLDLLVNNAGASWRGRFAETGWANVERHMHVNFDAPVRLTEALLPLLRRTAASSPGARRVSIVNVASTAGRVSRPGAGAYSASKAALAAWTDALALEELEDAVHVGLVMPGFVPT